MRVLYIDDDQAMIEMVEIMLIQQGLEVISTTDVREGMIMATREKPEVILMDYNMPIMTGAQVVNMLRRNGNTSQIPVIGVTAQDDALSHLNALGCDVVLRKPVNREDLINAIYQLTTR